MDKVIEAEPVAAIQRVEASGMAVERAPNAVLAEAQIAAKALSEVLANKKKKVMMNGEQYLEFEDWQTLGHFYGVTAGEDGEAEYMTINDVPGFRASAVAYRHGQVISRATQYCMRDEPNWSNKPLFQLSSMAQTRANAKVLRNVLAWVVVLAGYRPTPAEELDGMTSTVSAPRQTQQTHAAPMPNVYESNDVQLAAGEEIGIIEKLSDKTSKGGKPFAIFTFNGRSVTSWDTKLFPFLNSHKNEQIAAVLETKNGFTNLISCRALPAEIPEFDEPPITESPF